jgi:colanic acid biosynthesis glycosyl transferase WcaI
MPNFDRTLLTLPSQPTTITHLVPGPHVVRTCRLRFAAWRRSMKLILVNRYFFPDESATSRMLTSLAQSLVNSGWSVHVLTSRSLHNDLSVQLAEREHVEGIEVHRLRTTTFGRGWLPGRAIDYVTFHLATIWRLLRLAHRDDICVVCTDPPLLSVTAVLPIWLKRAMLVNWLLDLFPEIAIQLGMGNRHRVLMRVALRLRDFSLRRASVNVAPMKRMTEYLEDRGIPARALVTINHWSDGNAIRPLDPERNALRREWDLGDRFVVAYSGNFGRAHDFSTFLDAAERLRDHGDIVFMFIGGGHQRAAIEAAIANRRLGNVLMKPLQPRERLAETLGMAHMHLISLLPRMEPFVVPSKLYGILAAGRPTAFVGDLSGEIATVLGTSDCGQSVLPGDGEGLARIILRLSRDPELRLRLGRNASTVFETHYTETRGIVRWQQLLNDIAGAGLGNPSMTQRREPAPLRR